MGKLQDTIDKAVAAGARDVVIESIRSKPDATLAEVLDLLRGKYGGVAKTITIGELIDVAGGANGRSVTPEGEVNTRTPTGRRRYDQAVLQVLKVSPTPLSAPQIRSRVGGTPLQTRTALNRLIESGKVGWTGKARGTRYTPA